MNLTRVAVINNSPKYYVCRGICQTGNNLQLCIETNMFSRLGLEI